MFVPFLMDILEVVSTPPVPSSSVTAVAAHSVLKSRQKSLERCSRRDGVGSLKPYNISYNRSIIGRHTYVPAARPAQAPVSEALRGRRPPSPPVTNCRGSPWGPEHKAELDPPTHADGATARNGSRGLVLILAPAPGAALKYMVEWCHMVMHMSVDCTPAGSTTATRARSG